MLTDLLKGTTGKLVQGTTGEKIRQQIPREFLHVPFSRAQKEIAPYLTFYACLYRSKIGLMHSAMCADRFSRHLRWTSRAMQIALRYACAGVLLSRA